MVGGLRFVLAAAALTAIGAPGASASVLYVGDSLGVGTEPYLEEELGVEIDADVKTGRPSGVGVGVLAGLIGPEHDVVVFDLGTNDDPAAPEALAANLARAGELAGDRCLVIATLNRPPLNGVSVDGLNRAVTSFAAQTPTVSLVDWRATVAADPALLSDGVHPLGSGYAVRAGLFADSIGTCSSFPSGGDTGAEPNLSELPPEASGGSNDEPPEDEPEPDPERDGGPGPRLEALAGELARAIATGADFG